MNCEDTTGLLSDRLKGLLSDEAARRLDDHLASCPACAEEAEAIGNLWAGMDALDDHVPHERMRARFHAALAAYEQRPSGAFTESWLAGLWPRRPLLQAGYAAAMLAVGVVIGYSIPSADERELAELQHEFRHMPAVLLGHQSASERLRGVEWSRQVDIDARAVDALLEAMRRDSSLNVRLAAVEALGGYLDRPVVVPALTDTLARENAPLMQVALAELLLERGGSGGTAAVQEMLGRNEIDPSVGEYLRTVLAGSGDTQPPSDAL